MKGSYRPHRFRLPVPRDAISAWLKERKKNEIRDGIRAYAKRFSGTQCDLDPVLEQASVEHLLSTTKRRKRT